jgi:hypothetical protein
MSDAEFKEFRGHQKMALDLKEHGRRRQKPFSAKGIALKVSSDGTSTFFVKGNNGESFGSVRGPPKMQKESPSDAVVTCL